MHQFVSWIESVEESLNSTDKQCSEMRDKAANLGKVKVLSLCKDTYIAQDTILQDRRYTFYVFDW